MLSTIKLPKNLKKLNQGLLPRQKYKKAANSEGGSLSRDQESTAQDEKTTKTLNLSSAAVKVNVQRARSRDTGNEYSDMKVQNAGLQKKGSQDIEKGRVEPTQNRDQISSLITSQASSKKTLRTSRQGLPPTPNKFRRDHQVKPKDKAQEENSRNHHSVGHPESRDRPVAHKARCSLEIPSSQDCQTIQKSIEFQRGSAFDRQHAQPGRAPQQDRYSKDNQRQFTNNNGQLQLAVPESAPNGQTIPSDRVKVIEDLNPVDFAKYQQKVLRNSKKSPVPDSATNQSMNRRNLQPDSYPYHSQSILTMKAQLDQLNQQELGLLAPESASNPKIAAIDRDLARGSHISESQLSGSQQKAPSMINAHRQDQKNFRDTYARARRHVSNGGRSSHGRAVQLGDVVEGFKSLTREDSEQLVRVVSKERERGNANG